MTLCVAANFLFLCLGLSVAYLSGRQLSDGQQQFGTYSQDDVDALRALAEETGVVDLFLTYPCLALLMMLQFTLFQFCIIVYCLFDFLNIVSLMNGQVGSQTELLPLIFPEESQIHQVVILPCLS